VGRDIFTDGAMQWLKTLVPLSPCGRGARGEGAAVDSRSGSLAAISTLSDRSRGTSLDGLRGRAFKVLKVRRQLPLGKYIVDFVCLEKRLIIELDGGQHNAETQPQYDRVRDQSLRSQGSKCCGNEQRNLRRMGVHRRSGLESRIRGPLTPDPSPARGEGSMTVAFLPCPPPFSTR
jgi:Protein of unknown function (DUF559)